MNEKWMQKIREYVPYNEQEARDRELILRQLAAQEDIFFRRSALAHMTASAWVVNPSRTKVLMAYHNIYRSWAWLGGHADGDEDLLSVAMREVREESSLQRVRPVFEGIFSLEVLTVDGHVKSGRYVSSHLHLNVTYLLEADDRQRIREKRDENSAVRWFPPEEALKASTEPWMRENVYRKLIEKERMRTPA